MACISFGFDFRSHGFQQHRREICRIDRSVLAMVWRATWNSIPDGHQQGNDWMDRSPKVSQWLLVQRPYHCGLVEICGTLAEDAFKWNCWLSNVITMRLGDGTNQRSHLFPVPTECLDEERCCKWHWQQGTFLCGDLRSFGAICLWQFKGFVGSDAEGACRPSHIQWPLWSCWRMGD